MFVKQDSKLANVCQCRKLDICLHQDEEPSVVYRGLHTGCTATVSGNLTMAMCAVLQNSLRIPRRV